MCYVLSFARKVMINTRDTRPASGFDFEAVLYETAIEKGAVSIGPTKARCATFCELDGVNEFRLFHFSGLEPEGPGLHSYLGHGHSVFCDFHCGHSLISTFNVSEGPYRKSASQTDFLNVEKYLDFTIRY